MGEHMHPAQARELAEELRIYRELAGIPGQALADRLGWSASKVSRIENGLTSISEVDVVRFAAHCGVTPDGLDQLLLMCREPGAQGYWLTDRLSTLIFHENSAVASASYDPLVVPGLLQTQEYAAALIGPSRPWLVDMRMERQRLLNTRPFEFFVHEQALRLPVVGDRMMNEQLLKLVLIAEQPMVTLRVVPASAGASSMLGGEFVLFSYDGHRPLVYLEHRVLGIFLNDEEHVAKFHGTVARLSEVALGSGESREMLAALASEFDRPEASPDAPDNVAKEQL